MKNYTKKHIISSAAVSSAFTAAAVLALTSGFSIINAGSTYNADVNGDGTVNVMDLNIVKNIVLSSETEQNENPEPAVSATWGRRKNVEVIGSWNSYDDTSWNIVFTASEDIRNVNLYTVTYDEYLIPSFESVYYLPELKSGQSFDAGLSTEMKEYPDAAVSWLDPEGKVNMYFAVHVGNGENMEMLSVKNPDGTNRYADEFFRISGLWYVDGKSDSACICITYDGKFKTYYADGSQEMEGTLKLESDDGEQYLAFFKNGTEKVYSVPYSVAMKEFDLKITDSTSLHFINTGGLGAMDDGQGE